MNAPDPAALLKPPAPAFVPGVFPKMPAANYHAVEALSSGGAKKILRSPAHFRVYRDQQSVQSDPMRLGEAIHCGALEPGAFASRIAVLPEVNRRTNLGKAAIADFVALNPGRLLLDQAEFDCTRRCVDAVLAHPAASELLRDAEIETSLFWNDGRYAVPCKARWDARKFGGLIDLKSCKDASKEEFAKAIANFDYHIQGAHYYSGAEHCLNATPSFFIFIAVETEPPHGVAVYELGRASMLAGMREMDEALARYKAALESGQWGGYPTTVEEIQLPRWKLKFDV